VTSATCSSAGKAVALAVAVAAALAMPIALAASGTRAAHRPRQVDLSRAQGAQTEASIAIDPTDPSVLLAASQNGFTCSVRVYSSRDGGRSWRSTKVATPDAAPTSRAPAWRGHICAGNEWVGIDAMGGQYLAFVAGDDALAPRGWTLFFARRDGSAARWGRPVRVGGGDAGHDDKPMLLVDTAPTSPYRGTIYVGWTHQLADGTRAVLVAHSVDGGRTWSGPARVGDGWGVHLALSRTGSLDAAWMGSGGMLELGRSADGGDSFTPPRPFLSLLRYPEFGAGLVPAMRRQAVKLNPSLDVDRSSGRFAGRLYAAASVPSAAGRVIKLAVFDSGERKLFVRDLGPTRSHVSRDAFNPAVAVDQNSGTVWLCFYLTGTGKARILASYSCSSSRDGGMHWSTIRAVASVASNETQARGFRTPTGIDSEYASYEGLAAAHGSAYAVWTDTRRLKVLREEIYGARLRP
jgi:hypothetical protein